ncbi:MAG: class I SAM-dependent methyltransferase [Bacteroidetes bacterium]|nr:class I SAM-dependent methyltransferase [Bacteroidota bacterium]
MAAFEEYISVNRTLWNEKTKYHVSSPFYDMESFLGGRSSLNDIELELIGDVKDKAIAHLQCHFGQDSLSLARLGAHVTGVDLSDAAIDKAKELAMQLQLDARFIQSDIYSLPEQLYGQFDMVYSSYGVLGWLPDMKRWAQIVSKLLKKDGVLILVEFHPVVWMFDEHFKTVKYSYFNRETIEETEIGTYADREAPIALKSLSWNHNLSEVLQSLINVGLAIKTFSEYDYSPYSCFNDVVELAKGKYRIKGLEEKLPMVYAVKALKTSV